jgi:predicted aspartyl protease
VVSLAALPADGADWQAWTRHMDSARRAIQQGQDAAAEFWLSSAVREAERIDPRDARLAQSLTLLAELHRRQGRAPEAEAIERRLARARSAPTGPAADPDVVTALEAYAAFLRQIGQASDAGLVMSRVQRLREVRGGGAPDALLFFNPAGELRDFAVLLRAHGRDAEARAMEAMAAAEARALFERYARLRHRIRAESAIPSMVWVRQISAGAEAFEGGLLPEAEALFRDAVATAERFGGGDVRLAASLALVARVVAAQGNRHEFQEAVQRAVPILERAAGTQHSLTPRAFTSLAMAHLAHDFDPALTLAHMRRALAALRKDLPDDHPVVALHMAGLAAAHVALSQPTQARPLVERALVAAEREYVDDHVALAVGLMVVAQTYLRQGDPVTAGAVSRRVVAILRRMLHPGHPDVARAMRVDEAIQRQMAQRPAATNLTATTTVPIQFTGDSMLVRATFNGTQPAVLLLDTGASLTVIRPLMLARLGISIPRDARREHLHVAGGGTMAVAFVTLGSLQVGQARLENFEVGVAEVTPESAVLDGLLGADFLQRFRVTLDRHARRLTLAPLAR